MVARSVAAWINREKSPARTTTRLLELIAEVNGVDDDRLSFSQKRSGFGRFPVVGYVWYQDDYGAPRYIPYFHPHAGTDLFAVDGTPVIAVVDGVIWKMSNGGTGGTAIWLMGDDGVRYYYGHLKATVRGLQAGQRVRVGQHVAYVGATGASAAGTYPHVHFEVNPGGRGTINAKPILDRWLTEAETRQLRVLGYDVAPIDAPSLGGAWSMLFDRVSDPSASPPALWAAGYDASGATIAYADMALEHLLLEHDWSQVAAELPTGGSGEVAASSATAPLARLLEGLLASDHAE